MEQYTELICMLNDLILINTTRTRELKNRISELEETSEEISLFTQLVNDATKFKQQLINEVEKKGGTAIKKLTANAGKIYNSWKELRVWLMQKKELSILEKVQFDIKAALKIYQEALFAVANIPADTLDLIATQKAQLRECCKIIQERLLNGYYNYTDHQLL